ncbi:unnamed protein product [Diabrotica balteata]|uniref:Uncharacterized protein n=1 Tax=Diabrotica balteata TaxID=107213 RepID=A0A9N9T4V0_DIABA|nr:unnamed protein product [Diabrotica balteata]
MLPKMFKLSYIFIVAFTFSLCESFENHVKSFQTLDINLSRDELVVDDVTAESVFPLRNEITKWKSITVGPTAYSVGLAQTGFELTSWTLNANRTKFIMESNISISTENIPKDIILFHNRRNGKSEIVIIVSFSNSTRLDWFISVNNNINNIWSWNLDNKVNHFNYFKMSNRNILFIITNIGQGLLYEFNIKEDPFEKWVLQNLRLSSASYSVFNNYRGNYYLSILQQPQNQIIIYKYENNLFRNYTLLQSSNVSSMVSFDIGFKTFLAINGYSAGIFEFCKSGLTRLRVENSNLDGITYWLAIPIDTYRDDVLLVAERNVDHGTHDAFEVDIFTYNINKFEEHEDIPCFLFGEKTSRLTCFPNEQRLSGFGYISIENKIALIVPKSDKELLLFSLNSRIKEIEDPRRKELDELQEIKKKLELQIEELEDRLKAKTKQKMQNTKTVNPIVGAVEDPANVSIYLEELENIEAEIKKLSDRVNNITKNDKNTKFDKIIINGNVKFKSIDADKMEVENINQKNATELLIDIVRRDNITDVLRNKTFTELVTLKNLNANTVNGINASIIAFTDNPFVVDGNITFEKPVVLRNVYLSSGNLNDIDIEREAVILTKKHEGNLEFEEIKVEDNFKAAKLNNINLRRLSTARSSSNGSIDAEELSDFPDIHISKNLTVKSINGVNFTDFYHSLCLVNTYCYIPGEVKLKGVVNATKVFAENLNGLIYRLEYIFKNSETRVDITGKKTFRKSLKSSKLRSVGRINKINTKDLISTSFPQHLGNKTFKQIIVTNQLKVDGELVGKLAEQFLTNPSLEETDRLNYSVQFKNLEVNGNIYLSNKFMGKNYSKLLKSILYHDEQNATVSVKKTFTSGLNISQLNIQSDSINNVTLSSIVSTDKDQTLKINLLKGKIYITHLSVNGTFDGKNITEFDDSLVKLTGEQYIDSTLTFNDLEVNKNLEITENLNGIDTEEFLYTTGGGSVGKHINFDSISVDNMTVLGNIRGNVSGFNLQNFSENYFSATKNQTIPSQFNLKAATVDTFLVSRINGNINNISFDDESFNKNLREVLNLEKMKVDNLRIEESVKFRKVNDNPIETILPIGIRNPVSNSTRKNLTLETDLFVPSIKIHKLSSVNWNDFIEQVVFKNESNIAFSGNKSFENGINVKKLVEIKQLNDVPLEDILTKEKNQTIRGPLHIQGNVDFVKVYIKENMNGFSVPDTLKHILVSNRTYRVLNDIIFSRLPYIKFLNIQGRVNDKDIDKVFKNLAYKNKDILLTNDTVFKEPVYIKRNLAVSGFINHINFSDVYSKIVLTTSDTDIDSVVKFTKPTVVLYTLTVDEDLSTHLLAGYNTTEWLEKSISLNKGLIKGHYNFEHVLINNNLITDFVNDIDMKHIVPLKTDQNIDHLNFKLLRFVNDIPVGKTVNDLHLPAEVRRSLTMDTDQEISPTTIFNLILIHKNLRTSHLNNQETSKMVTTDTDQNLTASYHFNSKCVVENDLEVTGFINGVKLDDWKNKTLKINSESTQFVCNDWKLENITFLDNLESFNRVSDLNLTQVSNEIKARRDFKFQVENGTISDYKGICKDVTFFYDKTQSQIYKFKYFEIFQQLSFSTNINLVYTFLHKNDLYLLINKQDCLTDIKMFNGTSFVPFLVNISTGEFEQIVSTWDDDVLFLVTRASRKSKCPNTGGVNIWTFDESGVELKFTLENQELLQDSRIPSTFYVLGKDGVIEYKLKKNFESPKRYRRWEIFDKNAAFMPRGIKTGLAIRTGRNMIFLDKEDLQVKDIDNNVISESVIKGTTRMVDNSFIPGRNGGDIAVLTVGTKRSRNDLLAVASHEETVVKDSMDFVRIYDDPLVGKLFDKVPTYRPSSLLPLEFNQGETLLAFMENRRILKVYEYQGIQGFKHRTSIKLQASSLFQVNLPVKGHLNTRKVIGTINRNQITLLIALMDGNQISDDLNCTL